MSVIEKYKNNELSLGQAVNVVSVSVGITKEDAENIILGRD